MKRVLVYSHDTYGLGNIRRMLAVCERLCEVHADVTVLVVSGSPMLHAFRVSSRIDYVKLPCLARRSDGRYEVKSLGLDYAATLEMRSEMLRNAVTGFRPDLVIVDKKPKGIDDELGRAIEAAELMRPRPAMVLLLRDILDEPSRTAAVWRRNDHHGAIERHFDSVLVLGSQSVFDVSARYEFPDVVAEKVEYCGYIARPAPPGARARVRERHGLTERHRLALVTPGGGEDGGDVVECAVESLGHVGAVIDKMVVVAGPELPADARCRVHAAAQSARLDVVDFTDEMTSYMAAADLVVCMAGYNTICEVMTAETPAVAIPRVRPVREQLIRAETMRDLGLLRVVDPSDLSATRLSAEMTAALKDRPSAFTLDMNGLDAVEKHLAGWIGDV